MTENEIKRPDPRVLDYNTERATLRMPEYGRTVQEMVDYAKTLDDPQQRQRCAEAIVALMGSLGQHRGDSAEVEQKLWNHLAYIADYGLDIDYPVDIERPSDRPAPTQHLPYPQQRIARRHYGATVEAFLQKAAEMENPEERAELTRLLANQMKRDLGRWNRDAMNDRKVLDDIAQMTDGRVTPTPDNTRLLNDSAILNDVAQMMPSRKKRRK